MKNLKYKTRFELPLEESDFVCALAHFLEEVDKKPVSPEDVICSLVRMYARQLGKDFTKSIWNRALKDGRGPWK